MLRAEIYMGPYIKSTDSLVSGNRGRTDGKFDFVSPADDRRDRNADAREAGHHDGTLKDESPVVGFGCDGASLQFFFELIVDPRNKRDTQFQSHGGRGHCGSLQKRGRG